MIDSICPYPGLRPFTEEESIFFKGRDTHIRQIVQQLEERKIAVITGASGDGKSSLVYAGVIPNARAGFFRAQFSNWHICDFRPERSPLDNLSKVIAENLELDYDFVRTELDYGFSSLVDLYKQSKFWPGENQEANKGTNLFILADQFEEFFTNSENYSNGRPSNEAYTTVNLLLETAKIALAENLPIYVVFTMRSDYISQSVSFKGLPETIGFSQFFVPRLKRHELQTVIEDPAKLAAGKVSPRLTQVLINELPEGFDQLPLLQHALNRLWKQADNGSEELDFIHLAKIGGFDADLLEKSDKEEFDVYFNQLNEKSKAYYNNPIFTNILNFHANLLYDSSVDYAKSLSWLKNKPTYEDVQLILRTAFKSLTKIDQGRAVRNRSELLEITKIINKKTIDYEMVCAVLNVYRLPDSTFVRPFIEKDDIETEILPGDEVLDITHESLIRNWQLLHKWGQEELNYLSDYEDLKVQLNRWKDNNRQKAYLLNIGTLTYFENWYNDAQPNEYWIAKNENWLLPITEKREKAKIVFKEIIDFLEKSKKYIQRIAAAKKRLRLILLIGAIAAIVVLSGLSIWALSEKAFSQKQEAIAANQTQIALTEKEKAQNAQKLAEEQRLIAQKNAQEALWAKQMSDSARQVAIRAMAIADEQRILAETSAQNALEQKNLADAERKVAEKQKIIAETQRKKAVSASDSAQKLSYLALAQSLAYKVKNNFNDIQLNLLVAYQAYLFNKNSGGFEFDPVIFEGLKYASELDTVNQSEDFELNESILTLKVLDENRLLILYTNGDVVELDAKHKEVRKSNLLEKKDVAINAGFILNDSLLILSFDNYVNRMNDINNQQSYNISYHKKHIRAAAYIPAYKAVLTGGRDNILAYSTITKNKLKLKVSKKLENGIRTISFSEEQNEAWLGLHNGAVYTYNILSDKLEKVTLFKNARVNSILLMDKLGYAVIGLSNGHLIFINKENKMIENDLFVSYGEINALSTDPKEETLALALADNSVRVYQTGAFNEKPIIISGKYKHIDDIAIKSNGQILILDAGKEIKYYYLTPNDYAKYVKQSLKRNFSENEWNQIVGKNVPYEKTIN